MYAESPTSARHNRLLRGREIYLGIPTPPLNEAEVIGREDELRLAWLCASDEDRAEIEAACGVPPMPALPPLQPGEVYSFEMFAPHLEVEALTAHEAQQHAGDLARVLGSNGFFCPALVVGPRVWIVRAEGPAKMRREVKWR